MNDLKIFWATGFGNEYYQEIFKKVKTSWDLLPGTVVFYVDDQIDELADDPRVQLTNLNLDNCPSSLEGLEIKFWKKSRSIISAITDAKKLGYDYCIWLDADVNVLHAPTLDTLLPNSSELISANSKLIKRKEKGSKGTSMDTGFVAFNLNHPGIDKCLKQYTKFWNSEELNELPYRYDTCVLERILEKNNFGWKNLWHGSITKGRSFCGFEDSDLDLYFFHYWGRGQKQQLK